MSAYNMPACNVNPVPSVVSREQATLSALSAAAERSERTARCFMAVHCIFRLQRYTYATVPWTLTVYGAATENAPPAARRRMPSQGVSATSRPSGFSHKAAC